jgi:hypothetical protein
MPPVWTCGAYRLGHDVHFIQVRLSGEDGPGEERTITSVADDGTISFTRGAAVWNHDPERLRTILAEHGYAARLGSKGVLRVPHDDAGAYCFSVADEPDPCRDDTAEVRPGESLIDEILRRGGVLRSVRSVLDDLDDTRE